MEIFKGGRISVEKKTFQFPNGVKRNKVVVHTGNAAIILPIIEDSCVLIKQYRFVIDDYIYEAPAGTLNPGEDPKACAYRELIEEAKLEAKTLIPRGFIWTTPGFTDEKIFLFEARDCTSSTKFPPDEDEIIDVVRVPIDEVWEMVRDGRISDAKTIAIIARCLR